MQLVRLFLILGSLSVSLTARAGDQAASKSPAPGQLLYQSVCVQCHGPQGQGNEQLKAPAIAGMPAWYVTQQLHNFREGRRGMKPEDVSGTLMAGIAKALLPEHLPAVAAVVEKMTLVPAPKAVALKEPNLEEGRLLFSERCMECHRFNGSGEMTFGSPPLIGLQDWYLLAQIDKFKHGSRGIDPNDANGAKMVLSSQFIESEQAKHDVVAFILSLNPKPEDKATDKLFTPTAGESASR